MARLSKFTPTLAAAAAALILAAGAAAQPEQRRGDRPPPPPRGGELRGPAVRDDRAPGTAEGFVPGSEKRMGMGDRIPPRVFLDALRSLGDDNLPDGVRATPEQMDKLTAMSEAFRARREEYAKQHADEVRKLRDDAGMRPGEGRRGPGGPGGPGGEARPGRGGPGGPGGPGPGGPRPEGRGGDRPAPPPPGNDAMDGAGVDPAKREQARARLREIEGASPKIEDVYTKAWAELNDAQKKHVEAKLAEFRERGAREREDNYVRQRVGDGAGPGRPGAAGGPDARRSLTDDRKGPADDRGLRERRDRLVRIFEQLPPEEQDRLLARLEERFADRLGAGGNDARPPAPSAPTESRPRRRRGEGGGNPPPRPPE